MSKKIYRLTESELQHLVKESVTKILMNEWNGSDELEWEEKMAGNSLDDDDEGSSNVEEGYSLAPWEQADPIEDQGEYGVESFKNNQNYSHFAVNKATNKIVNGWDYSEYDPSELRQFKKDYFDVDMVDYGFNPKDYKIVTGKYLLRQGIDPDDNNNWANS